MTHISHIAAFRAQADFAPDAKIKIGENIWTPETAGARLYTEVLSKHPSTVQKAIDLASELKERPFTAKQTIGHLKWIYTAGQLEVDGKSYPVEAKPTKVVAEKPAEPKPEKPAKAKTEKAKVVAEKPKVMASRKRTHVKTKKAP
jgi:hypothetical protein